MSFTKDALLGTAAALAFTVAVFGTPALAQNDGGSQQQQAGPQAGSGDAMNGGGQAGDRDLLVATVGAAEIRESDVMAALAGLPERARQQPPRVLVPAVVNQLILRELALEAAREANLAEDPEVVAITGDGDEDRLEQALVRVWFQRELADRVSEADIEAAYEDLQEANPDMDRSLSEVRPQIRDMLQRQAASAVGAELREDAEITFYNEEGDPVETGGQQ